jgi:thioredoxin 1
MGDELDEIRKRKMKELMRRMSETEESEPQEKAPDKPLDLDDGTLPQAIAKYSPLVVDCWAPWCGPCRMVSPIVERLAKKYTGKMVFGELNVDRNQQTAAKYQIMSIPALLVFKGGKHVDTIIGAMPQQALEKRLAKYL